MGKKKGTVDWGKHVNRAIALGSIRKAIEAGTTDNIKYNALLIRIKKADRWEEYLQAKREIRDDMTADVEIQRVQTASELLTTASAIAIKMRTRPDAGGGLSTLVNGAVELIGAPLQIEADVEVRNRGEDEAVETLMRIIGNNRKRALNAGDEEDDIQDAEIVEEVEA